jgi:hypothetical protein
MVNKDIKSRRIESTISDIEKQEIDQISSACADLERNFLGKAWSKAEDKKRTPDGHMEARDATKFDKSNYNGIAVGRRLVAGRDTGELCIKLLVERKAPPDAIEYEALAEPSWKGFKTDVVQAGILRARSGSQLIPPVAHLNPLQRHRPAPGGVSVGHKSITAGTLGCWCTSGQEDNLILSNNHVLANSNQSQIGDAIFQPGPLDGGIDPRNKIAELFKFVPLDFSGGDNFVDAALAKPVNPDVVSPDIANIGGVTGLVCNASLNTAVQKSGRTTGHTTGEITGLNATVRVDYREAGTAVFRGQYIITPGGFSDGGDSGSLIVTNSNRAIALLFGGSDLQTIANPICRVMDELDITGIL